MSSVKSQAELVARRAELLAELFLQDLGATFVSRPASEGDIDFIVAFPNGEGGTNLSAVEIKATDRPVGSTYLLDTKWYKRLAHSNVPSLLLVVDAKQNRLYYAWPKDDINVVSGTRTVRVPLVLIDDIAKDQIRERLAGVDMASSSSRRRR